jgi:hypothetical protein
MDLPDAMTYATNARAADVVYATATAEAQRINTVGRSGANAMIGMAAAAASYAYSLAESVAFANLQSALAGWVESNEDPAVLGLRPAYQAAQAASYHTAMTALEEDHASAWA